MELRGLARGVKPRGVMANVEVGFMFLGQFRKIRCRSKFCPSCQCRTVFTAGSYALSQLFGSRPSPKTPAAGEALFVLLYGNVLPGLVGIQLLIPLHDLPQRPVRVQHHDIVPCFCQRFGLLHHPRRTHQIPRSYDADACHDKSELPPGSRFAKP